MFKFLKDKIKSAVSSFSKKVDEKAEEQVEEISKPVEKIQMQPEKKTVQKQKSDSKSDSKPDSKLPKKEVLVDKPKKSDVIIQKNQESQTVVKEKKIQEKQSKPVEEMIQEQKSEIEVVAQSAVKKNETIEESEPVSVEKQAEKKGFFSRFTEKITKKKLSLEQFEELFFDLEIVLLENNVAVEVIEKLKIDLQKKLVNNAVERSKISTVVQETLHKSITEILTFEKVDILKNISTKRPYIISFIGVNGSGKTTHLAKFVQLLQNNNISCVVGACDTFRAAAIQQLEEHTTRLGVKLIKHDYGADAAAVAFDAVAHATAKKIDVVLLDTAGRLHSNSNLMDELRKINRVVNPDFTFFVGESITGNDCIEQAVKFDEAVGVNGIILSKADIDEKGGAAISVSYVTKKPIVYFGVGQMYDDLEEFDKEKVMQTLGL